MTGSTASPESGREARPEPLLIKRYASRRLYNTETSDYVTLEDIARIIREGREVQIVDLKSGEDVTRQYLLQIIADHESRGENVLPIPVLTDLVRAYTSQVQSVLPAFLAQSFEMLQRSQAEWMKTMAGSAPNPFTAPLTAPMAMMTELQRQQQEFLSNLMGMGKSKPAADETAGQSAAPEGGDQSAEELAEIRRQLAELKDKLSKLD